MNNEQYYVDLINDLTISHFLKNMTWENVGVHSTHKVNGIVYPNKKYYTAVVHILIYNLKDGQKRLTPRVDLGFGMMTDEEYNTKMSDENFKNQVLEGLRKKAYRKFNCEDVDTSNYEEKLNHLMNLLNRSYTCKRLTNLKWEDLKITQSNGYVNAKLQLPRYYIKNTYKDTKQDHVVTVTIGRKDKAVIDIQDPNFKDAVFNDLVKRATVKFGCNDI